MLNRLHIATYNIHKGFSSFNKRLIVHKQRDCLRDLNADIVFLQEVVGHHAKHAARYTNWPNGGQHEFFADSTWPESVYGKNAVYESGHHGNAILSRYPIVSWENEDISAHRFESRGLLHCEISIPHWQENLHCICVHLGLFKKGRHAQLKALKRRIKRLVPEHAPLVIAGDFNDWREMTGPTVANALDLTEVFEFTDGRAARSFPSALPILRLDRIYVRGFHIENASVHHGHPWSKTSDHAALSTNVIRR
ncbi:endonuclease/exonuclease/phosphatase family protein [Nitrosomonas sp.]|uniref:endonuclease/exonuclease/phosphatase family protein n=1 Tax=Nitrosomonas sp. TaxID=42353 RepID=UPI001DBF5893|nr:endonuclease/exonuclease/phosphatase family protein [Nitrosomonas sp.]MCB1948779.1 endonuclease/exonuclease/phosphatase family protein [Nitrosomonas sp.]MCP5243582.1 endonuclease/exonuclease/phosphatase family protein [Burkholderiales bacterium]MDR4515377.1 endonuclease/exonuclease/phosphatase family protein [Nitrosomonas sp.]